MEGFIKGVHICLWRNLHVGSDSYKKLNCIYEWIHKRSSHISMDVFICRVGFHIRSSHLFMVGFIFREGFAKVVHTYLRTDS